MDILSVKGQNFLALSEFYVETADRGLVLIQGDNKSDTSTDSNGAGKSSIADSISWALYGVTARGITGDKIVKRDTKGDTMVQVLVQDGGTKYRIERYRKHSTYKNELRVYQILPDGTENDLSKGTDKETQLVVNGIMGCTVDVFNAAIYAGQEQMPNLPGLTDKGLKLLLEEAAGTEELADCYTLARQRALEATKALDVEKSALNILEGSKSDTEALVTQAQETVQQFEDGRRDRAKAVLAQTLPHSDLINTLNAEIAGLMSQEDIDAAIAAVQGKIDAVGAEGVEESRLNLAFNEAGKRVAGTRVAVENLKRAAEKEAHHLAHVDDRVGHPCSECGKLYEVADLAEAKKRREQSYQAALDAVVTVEKKLAEEEANLAAAQAALIKFQQGMTDVSAEVAELQRLNGIARQLQDRKNKVAATESTIAKLKADAAAKLTEANPHIGHVETLQKRVTDIEAQITAKKAGMQELEDKAAMLQDAVTVFGPAGVRAHILDLITPFLNDRTRDYLGALSDGNIHAVWSTLTKTAKGELKEKFNIEVSNDLGGDSFDALSGGEKRKVRLATAMALQEMVASRASKPIGLFIADEIDDALDPAGLERLMGILDKRAKETGSVLVISHNGLADWVDQVITVEKNGKSSTVSGATHKSF